MKRFLAAIALAVFLMSSNPEIILAAPSVSSISDNRTSYPNSSIPTYKKLEITFSASTISQDLFLPYDPTPPTGISAGKGVSIEGIFTNPQGKIIQQPGFIYQDYDLSQKVNPIELNRDWIYPKNIPIWKIRFSPNIAGTWSYKIKIADASGTSESSSIQFNVTASSSNGFVRVSSRDSRYFEFDNGIYFPALGYNTYYNRVSYQNPVLDNQKNFQLMGQNNVQLIRLWLSQWNLYGSIPGIWYWVNNVKAPQENPERLTAAQSYLTHDFSMSMKASDNLCMSTGHYLAPEIAVKPNTSYRVKIRAKTINLTGPKIAGKPFGLNAKVFMDGNSWVSNCYDSGVGTLATSYLSGTNNWTEVTGTFTTGNVNFLSAFYLALENVTGGEVYIDHVWLEENTGNWGDTGNLLMQPGMSPIQYADFHQSFALDKVVELAEQNGVYLKPVVLEKQERLFGLIDFNGNLTLDPDADNADYFYGNGRTMTKGRWYQQAWWRYLQARWGYSTAIQSWELLNEGNPNFENHAILTDEFGKYMKCRVFGVEPGLGNSAKCTPASPNYHLTSTSNWNSFPEDSFWNDPTMPNIDFGDIHLYAMLGTNVSTKVNESCTLPNNFGSIDYIYTPTEMYDSALVTQKIGTYIGAKSPCGANKPVIRGEISFTDSVSTDNPTPLFAKDTGGVWLHKFIWGGINPYGIIESYWASTEHIYHYTPTDQDQLGIYGSGATQFDYRDHYKRYYQFIKDIPLSNGKYADANTTSSNTNVRAWGQKDTTNGRAHLWIDNKNHTWKAVVDGSSVSPQSASISLSGFAPTTSYPLEWWNTYTGTKTSTATTASDSTGKITLSVTNLTTDTAVRIGDYTITTSPTSTPTPILQGDVNNDGKVNMADLILVVSNFFTNSSVYDLDRNGKINTLDTTIVIKNWQP